MKKYLGLFIVLLLALVVNVNAIKAEDETSSDQKTTREELQKENREQRDVIKNERRDKIEEIKKQIEATREEAKQKMEALREKIKEEKNTIKAKIKEERVIGREKALERFDKAVEKISELKDKVSAQITKLEAKGVDVTNAKAFVIIAETKLTDTKTKIAEAHILLSTSIDQLSKENKTTLRNLTQEIQTLLKESHGALIDALKSLKNGVKVMREGKRNTEKENNNNENQ